MANPKVGDIKYYHDSGDIFRVEVLAIEEKSYGRAPGEEYALKLLEVVDSTAGNPPRAGLEFTVWRAKEAHGYSGWHLSDR